MSVDKRADVMDIKVIFEGFDHYGALMKMEMSDSWKFRKIVNGGRKSLWLERFRDEGIKEDYT